MSIISATPVPIGGGSSTPPPFTIHVAASGIEGDPDPSHNFDLFNITGSDALTGQTFSLDSAPLLERFAQFMTNGIQGNLVFFLRDSAGGGGGIHSRKINFSPDSVNGVDLQGFVIAGCELRINHYKDLGLQPDGLFHADGQVTLTIKGWSFSALAATRATLTEIILFGVGRDPCGVAVRPGSGPVPAAPWGWTSLPVADQQVLVDMALRQVTRLLTRLPSE